MPGIFSGAITGSSIRDFGPMSQPHASPGQRTVGTMRRFDEEYDPEAVQTATPGVRLVERSYLVHYTARREASFGLRPPEIWPIDPSSIPSENDMTPINRPPRSCILTVNGGSSSLKFAVFDHDSAHADSPQRVMAGKIERIGLPDARLTVSRPEGKTKETSNVDVSDLGASAEVLITLLDKHVGRDALAGVGHRVVHGGPRYHRPEPITGEVIAELRRLSPLDVDHLPGEIALIDRFQQLRPGLFQVACFDTSFHHDMPRVAQIVPIPRRYEAAGVRRYGFHGLSYAYLVDELERVAGREAAAGPCRSGSPWLGGQPGRGSAREVDRYHHGADAGGGNRDGDAHRRRRSRTPLFPAQNTRARRPNSFTRS